MKNMVSLIIVNYNGRRFLPRLFKSIAKQTVKNYESILVDNGSSDDSLAYVSRYFPQVKIVKTGNNGFGCGCNRGVEAASGEYFAFLNEDMYLPENFVEVMLTAYQRKENQKIKVGGISCKLVDFDSNPDDMPNKYGGQIDLFGFPINRYFRSDIFTISGCPFFISQKTLKKVRGWNESIFLYGEDMDLSWRLKILGYTNFMEHKTHIFHFGGGTTGNFGPIKIAHNLTISLVPMLVNYSTFTLLMILPIYFIYILLINIFLFLAKKFDYQYPQAIVLRYLSILKNWPKIIKMRRYIQSKRIKSDWYIFHYVSFLPAFLVNSSYQKLSSQYVIKN